MHLAMLPAAPVFPEYFGTANRATQHGRLPTDRDRPVDAFGDA